MVIKLVSLKPFTEQWFANWISSLGLVSIAISYLTPGSGTAYFLFSLILGLWGLRLHPFVFSKWREEMRLMWGAAAVVAGVFVLVGLLIGDEAHALTSMLLPLALCAILPWYAESSYVSVRNVGVCLIMAGFACGLVSVYEVFYEGLRRSGGGANPIMYAATTSTVAALCFYWSFSFPMSWLMRFAMLAATAATVLSGTRSAWLVLAVAFCGIGVWKLLNGKGKDRTAVLFSALAILGLVFLLVQHPSVEDRIGYTRTELTSLSVAPEVSDSAYTSSFGIRLTVWAVSLDAILTAPLGMTREEFVGVLSEKAEEGLIPHFFSQGHYWHPHNQFLQIALHDGWLALAAYIALLLVMWYLPLARYRRSKSHSGRLFAVSAAIVVVMASVASLADLVFVRRYSGLWIFWTYGLFLAASMSADRRGRAVTE